MRWNDDDDDREYSVVINHEEQYSIWPADREVPDGWKAVGTSGTKQECLDYIEEVWTDMRPLSLREKMAQVRRDHGSPYGRAAPLTARVVWTPATPRSRH